MKERYAIKCFYSKADEGWIAAAPELEGCSAFGESPEAAVKELRAAMDLWLEARRSRKWSVPKPLADKEPKGRYLLRLPKSLQRELEELAAEDGVSLNHLMVYLLAQGRERAKSGPSFGESVVREGRRRRR